MQDLENSVEAPEVAPQEIEQAPEQEIQQAAEKESRQDRNWRMMRQRQDELERDLKNKNEMIEKFMAMTMNKAQEPDELDAIADDDSLSKAQVKKLVEREREKARQVAREEAESVLKQQEQSRFMDRLRSQYSDFDEIVNSETLALLEENDPELANTIAETKDPYKIGVQSYKYIKALNLADKVPKARRVKEVEKKLEKNSKTVQSPQAYDKRPLAEAYKITDADKKNLYAEMTKYASMAGFDY